MTLPTLSTLAAPAALPDFRRALALRAMSSVYADLLGYLLAPQIAALLRYIADWTQHALINTLWNTGGASTRCWRCAYATSGSTRPYHSWCRSPNRPKLKI